MHFRMRCVEIRLPLIWDMICHLYLMLTAMNGRTPVLWCITTRLDTRHVKCRNETGWLLQRNM